MSRLNIPAWFAGALLFSAAFATYWNGIRTPFFFDDSAAILENASIRNLHDIGAVLSPPSDGSGVSGRPVVNLSFALNYALGGTHAIGYHLANSLIHGFAALALFGCIRRTLALPRLANHFHSRAIPLAFASAAVWTLHPLQTESVTCVIQRTELLVSLFYLCTLYCFIRATDNSKEWAALAIAAALLGMGSKEVMVSAPLVIFLYDRTFIGGSFKEAWCRRWRLHLGLAGTWLLLAVLVLRLGGTRGEAAGFGVGVAWWSYSLKQCEAIIRYLQLTIWPHPLVVFYGADVVQDPTAVWPQIGMLLGIILVVTWALHRWPVWGFLGAWFFAILAPSSSVVPLVTQTMAEHRMYLALVAPVIAGMLALFHWVGPRALGIALSAAAAFGVTSAQRNRDYRSDLAIWRDTVAKVPGNPRAHVNLGAALKNIGDLSGAFAQYQVASQLDPKSAEALNNIATIFIETNRPADAIEPCLQALRLKPNFALAHNNLGSALVQTGHVSEGISHLQTALSLRREFVEAHSNLASALLIVGDIQGAIYHADKAIQSKPNFALAHFNLAHAFLRMNDRSRAIAALEAAVQAQPAYAEAQSDLGGLLYEAGDAARAIHHFEAALRSRPDFIDARNNFGSALAQTGRTDEAIVQYRSAIRLNPAYPEAHLNLALVMAQLGRRDEAIAEFEETLRLRPDDATAKDALLRLRSKLPH